MAGGEPEAKRARTGGADGTMPPDLKEMIEKKLSELGEIEYHKRSHKKGPGPVPAKILEPGDLIHEKEETIRKGHSSRVHYTCCNPKCTEPIRTGARMCTHEHQKNSPAQVQLLWFLTSLVQVQPPEFSPP